MGESFATMSLRRGRVDEVEVDDDDLEDLEEDDYYEGAYNDDDDDDYRGGNARSAGRTPVSARLNKHTHQHMHNANEEEDDFGVPLGNDTPARKGRRNWGWVRSPPRKGETSVKAPGAAPVEYQQEQTQQEQRQQEQEQEQEHEARQTETVYGEQEEQEEMTPPKVD